MIKFASPRNNLRQTSEILDTIYEDNPGYWPHGLSVMHFNDLYMVEKSAATTPVGFVGWQEIQEGDDLVGYYSVGILPEHRRQGLAKQAVHKLLETHASKVDRVKAIIEDGNNASIALAKGLPLDEVEIMNKSSMDKQAFKGLGKLFSKDSLKGAGKHLAIGAVPAGINTAFTENYSKNPGLEDGSISEFLLNTLLGGIGSKGFSLQHGMGSTPHVAGVGSLATLGIPAKNLMFQGKNSLKDLPETLKNIPSGDVNVSGGGSNDGGFKGTIQNIINSDNLPTALAIGGVGAGALGLGAYGLHKWLRNEEDEKADRNRPRIKVTLPTKDENDVETSLDLPGSDINFSKKIYAELARDTKRRLRSGGKERTRRRTPVDV